MSRFDRFVAVVLAAQLILAPCGMAWGQTSRGGKGAGEGGGAPAGGKARKGEAKGQPGGGKVGVTSVPPSEMELPGGKALSRAVVPDQYALGPGDGLTINLWGEYDETFETRVTPDGKISLPTIGDLTLKGLTLTAAQKLIDGEVKKYYRNVKSGLSLTSLRVFEIGVLGEVLQPGSYLATPVKHVSDVIAQAGGILPGGSQRRVQLHRNGQVVAIADLTAFLRHGDESLNPFLQDGDKVIVPPIGDQRVTVYASEVSTGAPGVAGGGAVTENVIPNVVEIKEGERLSTVISEVGGVSPWWDLESVFIQRTIKVPDGTMQIPVNLRQYVVENDESQNPVLIKGDEVYFPAVVRRVLIAGSVKAPAAYPYLPGKSADAYLMQAGGPTIVADLGRSFIQRADGRVEPYSATAELNNGDSIIVLEKFFKTWQDYFALVGTISGVILGLVGFYAAFTNFGR